MFGRNRYEYDLAVIGLGPAGMAVSIMASQMGLRVCAIEANKVGGECMNVGCIPSKALLRMAKVRKTVARLDKYALAPLEPPRVLEPFGQVQQSLGYISQNKTMAMFDKVDMILQEGKARFIDRHTLDVGDRRGTPRRIFICVGTRPALPSFEGLDAKRVLTNENIFQLERIPESMTVLGGGAIATEMAQAFARLGSRVTMVMRGSGVMWREDADATALLTHSLEADGIEIRPNRTIRRIEHRDNGTTAVQADEDAPLEAEKLLVATGRRMDLGALELENAGVAYTDAGIKVNRHLRTTAGNIYAPGDCNGYAQFSHAAMHQGMLALINAMTPHPFKRNYQRYVVPWTVFTDPAFSWVGPRESELKKRGVKYEPITVRYEDYGAAIAEGVDSGFVRILTSPTGRIYSAGIIGEGSPEAINEWALAIQQRLRMHHIMFLQHSFPSMAFLSKRAAETWMTQRMQNPRLRGLARWMYRL